MQGSLGLLESALKRYLDRADFAQPTRVPNTRFTQTTLRATLCRKGRHLRTACERCDVCLSASVYLELHVHSSHTIFVHVTSTAVTIGSVLEALPYDTHFRFYRRCHIWTKWPEIGVRKGIHSTWLDIGQRDMTPQRKCKLTHQEQHRFERGVWSLDIIQ